MYEIIGSQINCKECTVTPSFTAVSTIEIGLFYAPAAKTKKERFNVLLISLSLQREVIHSSRTWVWHLFLGGKENVSLAEALNQARLPIIDYKTCRQKKFWGDRVRDSMICAGFRDTEGTPAACQVRILLYGEIHHGAQSSTLFIPSVLPFFLKGDSGGPLLCQVGRDRWEVHGIVSFGPIGCTVENKPSVFTRTAAYIPWIEATRIRDFFLHWIPTSKNSLPIFCRHRKSRDSNWFSAMSQSGSGPWTCLSICSPCTESWCPSSQTPATKLG